MNRLEQSTAGRTAIVLGMGGLAWLVWTVVPDLAVGTPFADYLYVNQVVAVCVLLSSVERLWSKYARGLLESH